MTFTAEMAFEQSEQGEPILLDRSRIGSICREHGTTADEYESDMQAQGADPLDSANLLGWLGY
jgi:hypothetical protein